MATNIINLGSLDGNNGFRIDGAVEFGFSGRLISNAGDMNGDGLDDVILNAPGVGASYVVFGKTSGFDPALTLSNLDGTNGFRLSGYGSGSSVSNAGDVNGDGFDDVIVGSYNDASYVVFGKASGFDAALDLSSLDGSNGFSLDGTAVTDDSAGFAVSNAGDVNGDGFDDVIVNAIDFSSPTGSSYVVFGNDTGFDAKLDLASLDGSNGFHLTGAPASGYNGFEISVSSAGDINGDGFDDVMVGATRDDSSYVVFGKASGFDAILDLSSLDGSNGFRLNGELYSNSGYSLSDAGDVNGDGFDDAIVGAGRADPNGIGLSGSSYVVFGKAAGFDAVVDLVNLDGSNGFRLDGVAERDYSGGAVSGAGDVNGDGFADLIIGAGGADPNGSTSGSSYVVFGKASGFGATLNLADLDSNSGFRVDGVGSFDRSGASVSGAGDINGDGFDDVVVGGNLLADPNDISNAGSSYVVFGRSDFGGGLSEILGTPEDDLLKGTSTAEHFKAGDGNDNLIGSGGADIFEGEAGNDKINVTDLNFASVDGGSGTDILHLDGKDLTLDLTNYLDKIQGIETICLYGRGNNTLMLTDAELKELSDTTDTLKLHGNAGDQVILEGEWMDEGKHGFYHTYTQDDAVVMVGMNMTAVIA